jgi:catalase
MTSRVKTPLLYLIPGLFLFLSPGGLPGAPDSLKDLSQQIFDVMSHAPGAQPGHRAVHAKGLVCQGTFEPSNGSQISRAAHFRGGPVPVIVRFSDGAPDPSIPDTSPDADPRGMAIRFMSGRGTDIVANSHNGFVVGTGEDFLALLQAKAATDRSKPHPWPIEQFLATHPRALKFVTDPKPVPASYATESFFGNNAFLFVNSRGNKQPGRYQIVPVAGPQYLDPAEVAAKAKSGDFLAEEMKGRLAKGPVKFRLLLQLAELGDNTADSSVVWPDTRRKVELGTITITSLAADNASAEKALAFDPARLADGIELSDDPLPALRSRVYAIGAAQRMAH